MVAALPVLAIAGQPAAATADTARVVPVDLTVRAGSVRATIESTAVDGSVSTLGPFRFRAEPTGLRRSPDGRFFAVLVGDWSSDHRGLAIVPTDGGPAFEVPTRTRRGGPYGTRPENLSWTSDSREVILGNADARDRPSSNVVLRCSVARRRCAGIPGVDGFAAAIPGGIVTSTALDTMTVEAPVSLVGRPDAADPATMRALRERWRSRTVLLGPGPRTLVARSASLLDGLHGATAIVAGPAGALLTQDRYRLRLERKHRGQYRVRATRNVRRWILVRPGGSTRTVVVPRLTVPKAHSTPVGDRRRMRAQRAYPRPRTPIGAGGWLAVTGAPIAVGGTEGLVLTTIAPGGQATFLRSGGRLASAAHLVRSVVGHAAIRGTASLDVVGHEPTTNAAIVGLHWFEGSASAAYEGSASDADRPTTHTATVRVPLDGRNATTLVSREREQAAW